MCISHPLTEEEEKLWNENKRKQFFADAKLAGLQDEQIESIINFVDFGIKNFEETVN